MSNEPTILSQDQYSHLEDALWFIMESHPEFNKLVQQGNREKMTAPVTDPEKTGELTADRPKVMLIPSGPVNGQSQVSNACARQLGYTLMLETGVKTTNPVGSINQLIDIVDRAFRAMGDRMPDLPWVNMIRVGQVPTQVEEIEGWVGAAQITVQVHVPNWEMEVGAWPQRRR